MADEGLSVPAVIESSDNLAKGVELLSASTAKYLSVVSATIVALDAKCTRFDNAFQTLQDKNEQLNDLAHNLCKENAECKSSAAALETRIKKLEEAARARSTATNYRRGRPLPHPTRTAATESTPVTIDLSSSPEPASAPQHATTPEVIPATCWLLQYPWLDQPASPARAPIKKLDTEPFEAMWNFYGQPGRLKDYTARCRARGMTGFEYMPDNGTRSARRTQRRAGTAAADPTAQKKTPAPSTKPRKEHTLERPSVVLPFPVYANDGPLHQASSIHANGSKRKRRPTETSELQPNISVRPKARKSGLADQDRAKQQRPVSIKTRGTE